ncbi:acetyl-CoA hydrolase/transferase family protein [Tuanshanicoccus lijuaniae]|uniref:acetyl-CoA hydrolase/transferase family protein n=1 Tax=Aerococcaceae bacterium zg-1292 TaxID=2774330 RepID=UPI001BD836AA|nr:acetyl-CoA hydrolase/transferase family protein [Aerococcaceae bacterium zg-BR9]MBS4455620.1 acetyl-CoA hydrolase/transferase family protein [Aerococcaceae bacterium zg-A91]MBS4457239.1 acetyl-CoA hydrolase/transferase family protein [Aerococcaceae bacterium zg-BR33]
MTTNYKKLYKEKLTTAKEAVKLIEANEGIIYPIQPGEPKGFHEALENIELSGNRLYRMLPGFPLLDKKQEEIKQISLFLSGYDRKAHKQGLVELLPNNFSDIPDLLLTREPNPVIVATVSPMDEDGNFSLGTSNSYVGPLVEYAKKIIVEVNEHMPHTFGEKNMIHIDQVDAIIENNVPLNTLPNLEPSEKDLKIGKIIADMVQDGDTIQIGFGSMPNAVMEYLKYKKDLGIHTEMLPDKLVDLVELGVVTNTQKEIHVGKSVATFAIGTQRLYDFMNNNPDVVMIPCNQTNALTELAKLNSLIAINSAVEVDFLGQCNSERVRDTYFSSTGGQHDFMKGVRLTHNGTGIICLYSTAKNDQYSTIVPSLFIGAPVSTTKNDIDTVVTEYGVAQLKGKTIPERVEALISIAHPNFREELREEAVKLGYLQDLIAV